ncbi:MAG: hypothetical protein VB934_15600 [Polyangiaceae bacterium]
MSGSPTGSGSGERSSDDSSSHNEAGATEASATEASPTGAGPTGAGDGEAGATTEKEDEGLNGCFDIFLSICVLWAILAQACEG